MKTMELSDQYGAVHETEMKEMLIRFLENYPDVKKVLLIPPDFTRYYSMAGKLTQMLYYLLKGRAQVKIIPAVGTHMPLTKEERELMFGDIPPECFLEHHWQTDTETLGRIPSEEVLEVSEGRFGEEIRVETNRELMHGGYGLIISLGQVVPHEVVGMSNYSKNIFVGIGGRDMINKSHMLGAVCGAEKAMGNDHAPAREIFDRAQQRYLKDLPLVYLFTVVEAAGREMLLRGIFIGDERGCFEKAVSLSQKVNVTYLEKPVKKMIAFLDSREFKSTWVGNKGIYRTRMAIEDGGELLLIAPGIRTFGENEEIDRVIRAYGYKGTGYILDLYKKGVFENRLMAAAHLIHGSSDGRFRITYATHPSLLSKEEVEGAGFSYMDVRSASEVYRPDRLKDGRNRLENGEEIYFVRNPALGLWRA